MLTDVGNHLQGDEYAEDDRDDDQTAGNSQEFLIVHYLFPLNETGLITTTYASTKVHCQAVSPIPTTAMHMSAAISKPRLATASIRTAPDGKYTFHQSGA